MLVGMLTEARWGSGFGGRGPTPPASLRRPTVALLASLGVPVAGGVRPVERKRRMAAKVKIEDGRIHLCPNTPSNKVDAFKTPS